MRLFGTDGIRGEAGVAPLDQSNVYRVGRALARNLGTEAPPRILIGRDTRESGTAIEAWLRAGVAAGGGEAVSAGVLTTPAVSVLTHRLGYAAGVVISASHNPHPDNGVKIFSGDGTKSGEALESAIENEVAETKAESLPPPIELPPSNRYLHEEYLSFLQSTLSPAPELSPFKVALDCANGAAYQLGPALLKRLGMKVFALSVVPDGRNINLNCGATHPEEVARRVVESGCHLGAALDGDGDRLLLADHEGRIVDGDAILLMCARRMKREGRLSASAVVATVMSNLALDKALEEEGLRLYRTQVGDKYVAEEMARRGAPLGGEQSGHIIFSDLAPTGDGLLTLIQVLRVLTLEGRPLADLARLRPFPQVLLNIRVKDKPDVRSVPEIARAMEVAERRLGPRGRILVRYSGTEPVLRIMLEGPEDDEIRALGDAIGSAARRTLGAP